VPLLLALATPLEKPHGLEHNSEHD